MPRWLDRRLTAAQQRCTNPNDYGWKNYGGRGIEFRFPSVLEAGLWIVEHLGLRRDLEIDRIDNNGHYEPGNIRYLTHAQNQYNKQASKRPMGWVFRQEEWPYAQNTVENRIAKGFTRTQILEQAQLAMIEKRKAWRTIAARFESMTF